jgi:peptidoglycan/LPS O-acetylase OafA/YrhL
VVKRGLTAICPLSAGRISFCLYLFHPPFYQTVSAWLVVRLVQAGWALGGAITAAGLISAPLLILMCYLLTLMVDDPAVRASHWIYATAFGEKAER